MYRDYTFYLIIDNDFVIDESCNFIKHVCIALNMVTVLNCLSDGFLSANDSIKKLRELRDVVNNFLKLINTINTDILGTENDKEVNFYTPNYDFIRHVKNLIPYMFLEHRVDVFVNKEYVYSCSIYFENDFTYGFKVFVRYEVNELNIKYKDIKKEILSFISYLTNNDGYKYFEELGLNSSKIAFKMMDVLMCNIKNNVSKEFFEVLVYPYFSDYITTDKYFPLICNKDEIEEIIKEDYYDDIYMKYIDIINLQLINYPELEECFYMLTKMWMIVFRYVHPLILDAYNGYISFYSPIDKEFIMDIFVPLNESTSFYMGSIKTIVSKVDNKNICIYSSPSNAHLSLCTNLRDIEMVSSCLYYILCIVDCVFRKINDEYLEYFDIQFIR